MSDAPERIWAKPGMPGYITDGPVAGVYDVEYRRADLPTPDPMDDPRVNALVELLKRLDRLGGLGSDTHERIRATLAALEPK